MHSIVQEYTRVTGTNTIQLEGALPGNRRVGVHYDDAATPHYYIYHLDADEWEQGIGTFDQETNSLARTTVTASSNSNSKVSFSAGRKVVVVGGTLRAPVYGSDPAGTGKGEIVLSGSTMKVHGDGLAETGGGGTFDNMPFAFDLDGISGSRWSRWTSGITFSTGAFGVEYSATPTANQFAIYGVQGGYGSTGSGWLTVGSQVSFLAHPTVNSGEANGDSFVFLGLAEDPNVLVTSNGFTAADRHIGFLVKSNSSQPSGRVYTTSDGSNGGNQTLTDLAMDAPLRLYTIRRTAAAEFEFYIGETLVATHEHSVSAAALEYICFGVGAGNDSPVAGIGLILIGIGGIRSFANQ